MAAYDKPTLVYFNILGRGEPIRMTFAACGVEYDEQAVPYGCLLYTSPSPRD